MNAMVWTLVFIGIEPPVSQATQIARIRSGVEGGGHNSKIDDDEEQQ